MRKRTVIEDPVLIRCHCPIVVVTSVDEYVSTMIDLGYGMAIFSTFVAGETDACSAFIKNVAPDNPLGIEGRVHLVAINAEAEGLDAEQIAGLLVHEASHILDQEMLMFGEEAPSSEFKAYSLQAISHMLWEAYKEAVDEDVEEASA